MDSTTQGSQPLYPSLSPTTPEETAQGSKPLYPSLSPITPEETAHQPLTSLPSSSPQQVNPEEAQPHHQAGPSSSASPVPPCKENAEKWGTQIMGPPAVPTCHPDNKKAALWGAAHDQQNNHHHHPYLQYNPIEKPSSSPMESVLHMFNSWSNKAESTANNIWHNLKTGPSVSKAAWGKVNLTAKAITGGGFESLYKQTFATHPSEKLKKSFACYLSTSTGPVAGTLYLSNIHVAFCSDRPLSFTAPSGQETWSYYKVMVPLSKIGTINPVIMRENPSEKENPSERYIQTVTVDGHDFWFMGFVNYDKASQHLSESMTNFVATGIAVQPPVA